MDKLKNKIVLVITMLIEFIQGVPPDYCTYPLNVSDCGVTPTPVFSYYKPGSRCEINFWRGCPTRNRFPTEFLCSYFCIANVKFVSDESTADHENLVEPGEDPCSGKINLSDCGKPEKVVYTYNENSHSCQKVLWKGCNTQNIFNSILTCNEMCLKFDSTGTSIAKKIDQLNYTQLDQLNSILDEFLSKNEGDKTTNAPENESVTEAPEETTAETQATDPVAEETAAETQVADHVAEETVAETQATDRVAEKTAAAETESTPTETTVTTPTENIVE